MPNLQVNGLRMNNPISFEYDFARSGGAVAQINTGIFVDPGTTFWLSDIWVITTVTDAGGTAAVNIGLNDGAAGADDVFVSAAAPAALLSGAVVGGVFLATTPYVATAHSVTGGPCEIVMNILNEPLTAGKFIWSGQSFTVPFNIFLP